MRKNLTIYQPERLEQEITNDMAALMDETLDLVFSVQRNHGEAAPRLAHVGYQTFL